MDPDIVRSSRTPRSPTTHVVADRAPTNDLRESSPLERLGRVEAVLLDMDGTMVDSDASVERAWMGWADEFGADPAAVRRIMHGRPAQETVRLLMPHVGDAAVAAAARRQLELQYHDLEDVVAGSGAELLLTALSRLGMPWAIVTSADTTLATARLQAVGIEPPMLITADDVTDGKPHPEGYLAAAHGVGVSPERCLVVEDSAVGVAAGRAAGALTAGLRGVDADLVVADLSRLAHLLSRESGRPWWRDAVGYEVYLPSYADGDGDGWGDLPGLTERLDHLAELGVDVLWLTACFVSPMRDHGYDIADYGHVDPRFGGDAAMQELLKEAHRLGLRVIGDLVVNHTSMDHPWFRSAQRSRHDPYRDYYVWRDPAPNGGPPNNWVSHFGGPAWTFDETTRQYHLHLFLPEQPDLNWQEPRVADEIDHVIDHWLSSGLDGFRIDTAAYLVKHPDLPDNPLLPASQLSPVRGATEEWRRQDHRHDIHQRGVQAIHRRWRRIADRHDALLVGEVYELDAAQLATYVQADGLHSCFWFGLVEAGWEADRLAKLVTGASSATTELSWALGNHDRTRATTRYGGGDLGRRRSLAMSVLLSVLPGITWIYQGEELGLDDGEVPVGHGADPLGRGEPAEGRDAVRTPMPWEHRPGLGFTTGRAWLGDGGRTAPDTVGHQAREPRSHLNTMRRMLAVRRWAHLVGVSAGSGGAVQHERLMEHEGLVALRRGRWWAVANLSDVQTPPLSMPVPVVFDTDDPTASPQRTHLWRGPLAPQQAVLLADGT